MEIVSPQKKCLSFVYMDILLVKSRVKKKSSIFGFCLHCPLLQFLFKYLESRVMSEFRLLNICEQRLSLLLPAPPPHPPSILPAT